MRCHQSAALCWNARWDRTFRIFHPAERKTVSASFLFFFYILVMCSGWEHEEGNLSAVVQRRTWDQSRGAPRLHGGSAETGNCSGKNIRKETCVKCELVYVYTVCIFLYCIIVTEFICIYECKCTDLFMSILQKYMDPSHFLGIFHLSVHKMRSLSKLE